MIFSCQMYRSAFVRLFLPVCLLFNLSIPTLEAKLWKVSYKEGKGTNAVHDRRPNPTFDLEKKTSTSRTTGLDDSTNANHIYETADDTNKDTTERFSPIWNDIQGIYPDSEMSAMLGGDVKQLNMEHGKSDSSHKGVNNKDSQRQPQATELKEDSEENVTGSKGPKLAKTTRKEIATNKMTNINNNVQGLGTEKLATNLLTRFRGQSSSMLKNNNNKVPMETKWAAALPVKEPMQNQNVFNAHNAIGPNVNGKVSVPLQFHILPIPVMQVETYPVQTMKILQSSLGKIGGSYTTSNAKMQPGTNHLQSSAKNQNIQQAINNIQVSRGTSKPSETIINNLQNNGKEEKGKGYFNPIKPQQAETAKLVSDSKMLVNVSETKDPKKERPGNAYFNPMEQMGPLLVGNLSTNSLQLLHQANGTAATLLNTNSLQENNASESQSKLLVSLGDALPSTNSGLAKPALSGKAQTSTPAEKLICGNIICPFTLVMDSKLKTSTAAVNITKNRPEKAANSPTSGAKALNTSGFLSNGSLSQPKKNTTTSIILGQGMNTPHSTRSKPNLTLAARKAKIKMMPATPNARVYRLWKAFSESKAKLKASHNPFISFNRARNQDPAIGETFNKIKDRQGHQTTAWIQQGNVQPAPLMRHPHFQIPNKHDSVLHVPPQIYGPCKDYDPRCPSLVMAGWCDYPISFNEEINVRDYCMASCGFCNNYQRNDNVFDSRKRTKNIEDNGFPEYNEKFFKRHVA